MPLRTLSGLQLLNLAADPTPVSGGVYYNTTATTIKYSDGVSWFAVGGTDLVGGFYKVLSTETLTVPVNRIVFMHSHSTTDGRVIVNGILITGAG